MVIFYHNKTGEIVASFPEAFVLDSKITVTRDNEDKSNYSRFVMSPQDSYDFENPYHPANIHAHTVVRDQKGVVIGLKRIRPSGNPRKDPVFKPMKEFTF